MQIIIWSKSVDLTNLCYHNKLLRCSISNLWYEDDPYEQPHRKQTHKSLLIISALVDVYVLNFIEPNSLLYNPIYILFKKDF